MSTKAAQIHQAVESLVSQGSALADAFRQVAADTGLKYDSVRGAYYTARRTAEGGSTTGASRPRRSKRRETTAEDAVASAVSTLEMAIAAIEDELEAARERAEEANAEYEAMTASSGPRIAAIKAKIAVLSETEGPSPVRPTPPRKEAKGS